MHIINAFVHSQKTFAHSFSLPPPPRFFLKCTCARTPAHTQQHRAVTAFSLQQCHADMRGPHLVQKTTEISLRTCITTVLLVCLPPPPTPSSPFPTFFLSLALSSRSLPLLPPTPAFLFFIVYHLSSSRLPPQFGSFSSAPFQPDTHTHTHACNHTPPPLCITWHCQVGETPLPSWTLTLFRLPGQRREMCAVRVRVCVWKRGQRQSKKKREKRG